MYIPLYDSSNAIEIILLTIIDGITANNYTINLKIIIPILSVDSIKLLNSSSV